MHLSELRRLYEEKMSDENKTIVDSAPSYESTGTAVKENEGAAQLDDSATKHTNSAVGDVASGGKKKKKTKKSKLMESSDSSSFNGEVNTQTALRVDGQQPKSNPGSEENDTVAAHAVETIHMVSEGLLIVCGHPSDLYFLLWRDDLSLQWSCDQMSSLEFVVVEIGTTLLCQQICTSNVALLCLARIVIPVVCTLHINKLTENLTSCRPPLE